MWQGFGQVISDLNWVSPMHEGLAAVKKGNPPEMHAYFIGERLVAVKGDSGKWSVLKF